MKRHPENIDFNKLYDRLNAQIKALKNYAEKLKKNNEKNPEKRFISEFSLPDIEQEIEIKEKLLKEYLIRATEYEEVEKIQYSEYKRNFKKLIRLANKYKSDLHIPYQIRKHLTEFLKYDVNTKTKTEKVVYYLSLKKEIEMCKKSVLRKNND